MQRPGTPILEKLLTCLASGLVLALVLADSVQAQNQKTTVVLLDSGVVARGPPEFPIPISVTIKPSSRSTRNWADSIPSTLQPKADYVSYRNTMIPMIPIL